MKTVSLELAKQLKEAGYPQESEFLWIADRAEVIGEKGSLVRASDEMGYVPPPVFQFYSPTADEILDQLPTGVDIFRNGNIPSQYCARYYPNAVMLASLGDPVADENGVFFFQEISLADAAAKMWLYLKKEGLL